MIFVECKPDLLLVQKITGIPKKEILHSGNKGEVIKNLSRSNRDNKNNFLVVICPVLEEWILKTARLGKIKMADYNLPENASRFHKTINLNLRKFEMLLEILLNSQRITALKSVLSTKNRPLSY